MNSSVIVAGARTPIGKFKGSLSSLSATELGSIAIKGAVDKAGLGPNHIDYAIVGHVLTAGAGQLPARQAAIGAGLNWNTPVLNINKVCLSGINAIALADQLIRAGEHDTIVAAGTESMSNAAHVLPGARAGYGYGDVTLLDSLYFDGLRDVYTKDSMGALTDDVNAQGDAFSREDMDAFAARSHQLADKAWEDGIFADEVVPVTIPQRKGDPIVVSRDEGIRSQLTVESLAKLKPAFAREGTITAGNASPLSDGAAAVVVMSKSKAQELGIEWLAEIVSHGSYAGPDSSLQLQPAGAVRIAAKKADIAPTDLELLEINEAFAAVGLSSTKALGIDPQRVNIHGGAIALGHPLGMSGTRVTLHVALELARRGSGIGAASLCGGGGQGDALILQRV